MPSRQHGPDLAQKTPPPVTFDRTERDQIIIPGTWLAARLEEVATNPSVASELRTIALTLARGQFQDLVLPPDVETVAFQVEERDGTTYVLEALPPGFLVAIGPDETGPA